MQCRALAQAGVSEAVSAVVSEAVGAMEEALGGKALIPLPGDGMDPPTVPLMVVLTL